MANLNEYDLSLNSFKDIEREKFTLSDIGSVIRSYRSQRGMSRQILANRSGISMRYLAQLESGGGNPTLAILKNIAYSLNVTLSSLLFLKSNKDTKIESIKSKFDQYNNSQINKILNFLEKIDSDGKKINKNKIALIGLRGAGKSTLGEMYSRENDIPMYEVTNEVEKLGGMNISEIIELGGQEMYRRLEFNAIHKLYKNKNKLIISTGGSVVSEKETFNFLLKNFYTIWIKANPKEHMDRVIKQGDSRPMRSNPKAMDDLNNILKERQHLYAKADLIIDTENKDANASYYNFKNKIDFNI